MIIESFMVGSKRRAIRDDKDAGNSEDINAGQLDDNREYEQHGGIKVPTPHVSYSEWTSHDDHLYREGTLHDDVHAIGETVSVGM